jgi:hypothetical protein
LTELIPLAVESVRLAFRTGFTATTIRDELEVTDAEETWAMQTSRGLGLGEADCLATIHQEEVSIHYPSEFDSHLIGQGIPDRKKSYISASFGKALTLQGPPSTLDKIHNHLRAQGKLSPPNSCQRMPIYTPYHAPHLYTDTEIARILDTTGSYASIVWEAVRPRLVSPVTGKLYDASNVREFLMGVLHDLLRAPIEWTTVTVGCTDIVSALKTPDWIVRAYGPTLAAGSLVSSLKKGAAIQAVLDNSLSTTEAVQRGVPTNEPIAIVGMSGRFPEAASHDELWEVLSKGIDCAKVVRPVETGDEGIS